MTESLMDQEWQVVAGFLPKDWRQLAHDKGAMRRESGEIRDPEVLLQILLMHLATGLSLKQAAARAGSQGLAKITDVALLKRLRTSGSWLGELSRKMFESSRFAHALVAAPRGYRLRAVDATTVEEPGASGTDWRIHYSLSLPEMRCDFYDVTDVRGGETFKRIPVAAGDLILGDRGYCHREGVAHVLNHGGDVIVRLNSSSFPLLEQNGEKAFSLLSHLRQLRGGEPGEWPVQFTAGEKKYSARLCAIRKSAHAAEKAKRALIRTAKKKQRAVKPETLECAEYTFMLVTVPETVLNTAQALELYRARWQIELCFKRLKSLFQLGHVPKRSDTSARAWIQGKLLSVLLIERLVDEARFFSPWGFRFASTKPLA